MVHLFAIATLSTQPIMAAPSFVQQSALQQYLLALSKTAGLSGTVLLETEPPGYEPEVTNIRNFPIEMTAFFDLGFTPDLRQRYLTENFVDPIDFQDTRFDLGQIDLSTLALYDPGQNGSPSQTEGAYQKWIKMLSAENAKEVQRFADQIPGSIYFQTRLNSQEVPRLGGYLVVPWEPTTGLPTSSAGPYRPTSVPANCSWLWQFGYPMDPPVASRMFDN